MFNVSIERRGDNLFIIKPPQGLPFWSKPVMSRLNYKYFAFRLNRALRKLGFKDYILWLYRPEYISGLQFFNYKKIVCDINDDLAAYEKDPIKQKYIRECVDSIARKSDLVVVTASALLEKFRGISKNIGLVPNGYDSLLFSHKRPGIPDDMRKINHPVIGFIGTLFSFLDYGLINFIVKNNPDKSFVFIGNCEENSKKAWSAITEFKNVFWLGRKKKEDIPAYISAFDVCINPFKIDDVSKSVSPLKVFEYLAVGKPVVSVKMESLEKEEVAPFIYFASSHQEFNEKLQLALIEKDAYKQKLDYQAVAKYSWETLFEKIAGMIDNLGQ
jgi:glycosyltransferase involved in cell wall biosynthesis